MPAVSILQTGLVFFGHDLSEDETIFYRPAVDRLEKYIFILLQMGRYFQTCCSRLLWLCVKLLYGLPGLSCILWTRQYFGPVVVVEDLYS